MCDRVANLWSDERQTTGLTQDEQIGFDRVGDDWGQEIPCGKCQVLVGRCVTMYAIQVQLSTYIEPAVR